MKFYINDGYLHHMNKKSLDDIILYLSNSDDVDFERVYSLDEADVVYSPSAYMCNNKYPDKKFIFGPHFSVFPNEEARKIKGKNAIYIQPSQPSVDTWANEFSYKDIPVKSFPFPLNLNDYQITNVDRDIVLVYFKERDPMELKLLEDFIKSKGIKYEIIKYGYYKEENYQKLLNRSKYVVCLGRHESQGFALESIMCKNIPLLVWGVKLRKQQYNCPVSYHGVLSEVSTVPYWDGSCGELFFNFDELEESYNKFILNLENYKPIEFIKNNLTIEICSNRLLELIDDIKINE